MMDFKEGEVLYFNKPLGWTSFKVVGMRVTTFAGG